MSDEQLERIRSKVMRNVKGKKGVTTIDTLDLLYIAKELTERRAQSAGETAQEPGLPTD